MYYIRESKICIKMILNFLSNTCLRLPRFFVKSANILLLLLLLIEIYSNFTILLCRTFRRTK